MHQEFDRNSSIGPGFPTDTELGGARDVPEPILKSRLVKGDRPNDSRPYAVDMKCDAYLSWIPIST